MSAKVMKGIGNRQKPNDKIYTPPKVVDIMLKFCEYKEGDLVLEPARGLGAIYDKLKEPKEYCEIEMDKDFFDYKKKVDLIITNPPYSILDKFIKHTIKLCNKFCFIIGQYSLTPKRIDIIEAEGFYITKMLLTKVPTWFQYSYIIVCEKLDEKPKKILFDSINLGGRCLYCGKSCGGGGKTRCKRKAVDTECRY